MFDDEIWFEPKLYGIGSGKPVHWKGWLLIAFHIVVALVCAVALVGSPQAIFRPHTPDVIALELLIAFAPMPLYVFHTRGGWRWRWGSDD